VKDGSGMKDEKTIMRSKEQGRRKEEEDH